ncbi:MAG: TonB-dependent receptor [Labilithrix sp.]|nr:TonB-dependent receptor [Labilithrix sp.]MCW5817517.1 TonB-dependent receptor [Labilithrix sp.]
MPRPASALVLGLVFAARVAAAEEAAEEADEVRVRGAAGNFASRATIEDSPRTVTDAASLVEPLPGVHVRRLGADDSFATLSIRGSTSTQVAVYLAGVPLSGGADPTLDLATLPLWPGARATVHRTFAPAALGRGSLGGTLVLDAPSARAPEETEVWAAAGAFGSRRLRLGNVARGPGGVRVATGLSASRSDDDFSYLDAGATDAAGRDVLRARENAGHAAAAGLASIALPLHFDGGDGAVTLTTLAQARRQRIPGPASRLTPGQELASTRLVQALELTLPRGLGARAWGRREGLALRDDPRYGPLFGPRRTDDAIVAAGGSVGWRGRPFEGARTEVRIDGSAERFAPGAWVDGVAPPAARRTNTGVALDASALVFDRVTVSASGRGDLWFDAADGTLSTTELRPTGHAGIEVPVGPISLASHAGWVTRPASFVERYGNRGAFLPSPNLRPESAFTADAGATFARRVGRLRVRAEAAGFATWAEDLITLQYAGAQRLARAVNVGEARLLGVESEVRASAYGLDMRVSYTGLASRNESRCNAGGCPPLSGRPSHDFVADLAYERGPVRVRYGVDYVSGITADASGAIEVPARLLHDASVRVAVPAVRGLTLTLDVRNLFDLRAAEYAAFFGGTNREPIGDLYDYPLPGRRLLLSVRWSSTQGALPPAPRSQP